MIKLSQQVLERGIAAATRNLRHLTGKFVENSRFPTEYALQMAGSWRIHDGRSRGKFFGPKTLLFFAPQVIDSTHLNFISFHAQNHMFVRNQRHPCPEIHIYDYAVYRDLVEKQPIQTSWLAYPCRQ
jgi:hypothetical protein